MIVPATIYASAIFGVSVPLDDPVPGPKMRRIEPDRGCCSGGRYRVVNAIVGLQIKPTDEIFINIEGGLRTIPFFGTTAGYYF